MRFALAALVVAMVPARQDALPEKTLQELKDATLFVKTKIGMLETYGTGFLLRKEGEVGYVVTSSWLVDAKDKGQTVKVVLRSGTKQSATLDAELVALDPDRQLGVLRVQSKDLPAPMVVAQEAKLRVGLGAFIFGFPFGEALATSEAGPNPTIAKGSILVLDKDGGPLRMLRVKGDFNPGNAGSPIVDATGAVIAIAAHRFGLWDVIESVGPGLIDDVFRGRAIKIRCEETACGDKAATVKVTASLVDPMGSLKSVSVIAGRRDAIVGECKPDAKGVWGPVLAGAKETPLKGDRVSASGDVALSNADKPGAVVEHFFQAKWTRADGATGYLAPEFVRIEFRAGGAPKRAVADWLGTDPAPRKPDPGQPEETGTELFGGRWDSAGATGVTFDFRAPHSDVCWSDDASAFYVADADGVVRKIAGPPFKEERCHKIGGADLRLTRSREGLVVSSAEKQEVLLLDPATLKITTRFGVGGIQGVAAHPAQSMAYATGFQGSILVLDLKKGALVKELFGRKLVADSKTAKRHKTTYELSEVDVLSLAPDGAFLFVGSAEGLHRLRINGESLVLEESGPRYTMRLKRIDVSPDGKYVCPVAYYERELDGHPRAGEGAVPVYKAGDLQSTVLALPAGREPRAVAFDKAAGRLYVGTAAGIKFYSLKGEEAGGLPRDFIEDIRQILVHPDGGKALVVGSSKVSWVEFPK